MFQYLGGTNSIYSIYRSVGRTKAHQVQKSIWQFKSNGSPCHYSYGTTSCKSDRNGETGIWFGSTPLYCRILSRLQVCHYYRNRRSWQYRIQSHRKTDSRSRMARYLCQTTNQSARRYDRSRCRSPWKWRRTLLARFCERRKRAASAQTGREMDTTPTAIYRSNFTTRYGNCR